MNNVAVIPHYFMYFLQNQNVDRKVAKTTTNVIINRLTENNESLETNESKESKESI